MLSKLATPLTKEYWARILPGLWARVWDIAVLLVVFWVLRLVLGAVVRRIFAPLIAKADRNGIGRGSRVRTLEALTQSILHYALIFIAGVRLLQILGFDPTSLLATAGVAGLAVGFGAQRLVRDVMTGFFILLEDQFAVGDYVAIGTVTGMVEEIGMRVTKIRDDSGRLTIIANGDIGLVTNYSRGLYRVPVEFSVSAAVSADQLDSLANAVGTVLGREVTLRGPISMDASKMTYRVETIAPPQERVAVEAELRRVLREKMTELGIPQA